MKKQKGKKKAFLAALLSAAVICQTLPAYQAGAAQGADGLCSHHTEHTPECGYVAEVTGSPCTHEHTEECDLEVTACLHEHTLECYGLSCGMEEHTHGEACWGEPELICTEEHEHTEDCYAAGALICTLEEHAHAEACYTLNCAHVCSKESGCVTQNHCVHEDYIDENGVEIKAAHDETCGYAAAVAGSPCTYVCEECKKEAAEAEKAVQESQQKIDNVQSLISALPEADSITAENLESVKAQLAEIEAAKAELDETQQSALNMEKYNAAVERVAVVEKELEDAKKAEEAQQKIDSVQKLISDLPEADSITTENLEDVKTKLEAIEAAKVELDESQQAGLSMEKYTAAAERVAVVEKELEDAKKAEEEAAKKAEESQQKIDSVQKLISDLPEADSITAENLEDVKTKLEAIEAAKVELDESQQAGLSMEKYTAAAERVAVVEKELEDAKKAEEEAAKKAEESQQKIDSVQKLISDLPEAEAVQALLENLQGREQELEEYRTQINEAKTAYDALLPEQQEQVEQTLADKLQGLLDCFAAPPVMQLAAARDSQEFKVAGIKYKIFVSPNSTRQGEVGVIGYESEPMGHLSLGEVTYEGETYLVVRIQDRAFEGCTGLTSVDLPNVQVIRPYAFRNTCLTSLYLPPSLITLESYAFADCKNLTTLICDREKAPNCTTTTFSNSPIMNFYIPEGATGYVDPPYLKKWPDNPKSLEQQITITGTVKAGDTGEPIEDSYVKVVIGEKEYTNSTDEKGAYTISISAQAEGQEYTIIVSKKGYLTVEETVTITETSVTKNFTLNPPPVAEVIIGDKTTGYNSLDEAVEAANSVQGNESVTLRMYENEKGRSVPVVLTRSMTFDLGGKKLEGYWFGENRGVLEITGGNVVVQNGTVSSAYSDTYAVQVGSGAALSGNATYEGTYALLNAGTVTEGIFQGNCATSGAIEGGTFKESSLKFGQGSCLTGGNFENTGLSVTDVGGVAGCLAVGYVGYDNAENKNIVLSRKTTGNWVSSFTGYIAEHEPHAYEYTNTGGENGNYIYTGSCPLCGANTPEGEGYIVSIPTNVQLGGDAIPVSVENKLSQEKTVTVSTADTVLLTRKDDKYLTEIKSTVDFETLSAAKGATVTGDLTFGTPVYKDSADAVIPAGSYSGTLTFTIGLE